MTPSNNTQPRVLLILGVMLILVGLGRLANPITYLPDDVRSQPWFYPVTSGLVILLGVWALVVGIQRLRARR